VGKKEIPISSEEIGISLAAIYKSSEEIGKSLCHLCISLPGIGISFFQLHKWKREIGAPKSYPIKSLRDLGSVRPSIS